MWETVPLLVALRALRRAWLVCLIPLAWDAVKWGLAVLMAPRGYYFARWDFTVGLARPFGSLAAQLLPPPALPSVEHLGVTLAPRVPVLPETAQVAGMITVLALDAMVKAGYLHLLFRALQGLRPSLRGMAEGALLHGWRLFLLVLLWMAGYSGLATLSEQGMLSQGAVTVLAGILVVLLGVAEFIIVAHDVWPPIAVLAAPVLAWKQLGELLSVWLPAAAATGLMTGLASWSGLPGWSLAVPYALLGTWLAAGGLQALSAGDLNLEEESPTPAGEAG